MGHLLAFLAGAGVATWYARHHSTYHFPPPDVGPYHFTAAGYLSQAERNKEWEEHRARFRHMSPQAGNMVRGYAFTALELEY